MGKRGDKCQEDLNNFLQRHCFEGLKQKLPPKVNASCLVSFESLTPIEVAEPWPFEAKERDSETSQGDDREYLGQGVAT